MKEPADRDHFRLLAAGRYILNNKANYDAKHFEVFMDGALFAYDFIKKMVPPPMTFPQEDAMWKKSLENI